MKKMKKIDKLNVNSISFESQKRIFGGGNDESVRTTSTSTKTLQCGDTEWTHRDDYGRLILRWTQPHQCVKLVDTAAVVR
jgi:hypothetical protein